MSTGQRGEASLLEGRPLAVGFFLLSSSEFVKNTLIHEDTLFFDIQLIDITGPPTSSGEYLVSYPRRMNHIYLAYGE